ncbi:MAG: histone deacetylase [Gammaproteobacteria bacterium]|nr:histone deacetylase [Gammaproteobacteria bacterium]
MKTGYIYDPVFLNHDTGRGHPETSQRLVSAHTHLTSQDFYNKLSLFPPRDAEIKWIETIHQLDYIERVKSSCKSGMRMIDTPDVQISSESYLVSLKATGSLLELADRIMEDEIDNGFAMVRPPGHHAENSTAMGFCLFNSIAIVARYLQQKYQQQRIIILDWDVHHGNGTQHTFEEDPDVFYISLHQYPHYPGTGAQYEMGTGKGAGTTLNCPMSAGLGDDAYREAFKEKILPAVRDFNPDVILISAGFDAHQADPLASIRLKTESFGWMTQEMMSLAEKYCGGKLISVLEGGYDFQALAKSVTEHVRVLSQS